MSLNFNQAYFLTGFNEVGELGYGGVDNNSFAVSLVAALGPAIGLGLSAKSMPERAVAGISVVLILHTVHAYLLARRHGWLDRRACHHLRGAAEEALIRRRGLPGVSGCGAARGPSSHRALQLVVEPRIERNRSAQSRVDLWAACWRMAVDSPLVGVGPRNFPVLAGNYGFAQGKEAHSTWMQTLAEMGFPGVLSLVLFYLAAIRKLWPIAP